MSVKIFLTFSFLIFLKISDFEMIEINICIFFLLDTENMKEGMLISHQA